MKDQTVLIYLERNGGTIMIGKDGLIKGGTMLTIGRNGLMKDQTILIYFERNGGTMIGKGGRPLMKEPEFYKLVRDRE